MPAYLKKFPLLILLLCILFGVASCSTTSINIVRTTWEPIENEYFSFEPATIFSDIDNDTEHFTRLDEPVDDSRPGEHYRWNQAEYYEIVSSIFENVWQESLQDFRLEKVLFRGICEFVDDGYYLGAFQFYRLSTPDQAGFVTKEIKSVGIEPIYGKIDVWTDVSHMPSEYLAAKDNHFESNSNILSADDALKIAEDVAGANYRDQVQNDCNLRITYNLEDDEEEYERWRIRYFSKLPLLTIVVNAETGEYEVNPK